MDAPAGYMTISTLSFQGSIWPSFLLSFIVVNQRRACVRTFADEDVALNVDDVVLGEAVHGDLRLGVTFVVMDEIRGYLLLRAPADYTCNNYGSENDETDISASTVISV